MVLNGWVVNHKLVKVLSLFAAREVILVGPIQIVKLEYFIVILLPILIGRPINLL